jgi:hypothetical protein
MEELRVIGASIMPGVTSTNRTRARHRDRRNGRGHDQGGRAEAARGLRVIGQESQGEDKIPFVAMGASNDP